MRGRFLTIAIAMALASSMSSTSLASPTVPLDDPVYEELARLRALGRISSYSFGVGPLTTARIQDVLAATGQPPATPRFVERRFWLAAFQQATERLVLMSDELRDYSQPSRHRDIFGGIAVSCERQEGRPCGDGAGTIAEIDSAAGYGRWISAATRLRLSVGSDNYRIAPVLDRAYVNAEWGPVLFEVGRDVLVLGPGVHTQLLWGTNAAPLDQIRLSTSHPLKIPRLPITAGALYAVGRLRDPQTFHGTLVTIARIELTFADQLQIGAQQLLQLGGDGAIQYGFGDFLAEHFTRTGNAPGAGGSNRRDSLDATYTNKWARGLRIYYELAFEDFRKHVVDMFLYDCDHLLGFEMAALTRDGRHGFVVELQHNGPYSQTHSYFTTGMTNAGFAAGAPLGPDSWSLFVQARLDLPHAVTLWPWAEWARLASDEYNAIEHGPILLVAREPAETRYRGGVDARLILARQHVRFTGRALLEVVDGFGFVPGAHRANGGVELDVTWTPPL